MLYYNVIDYYSEVTQLLKKLIGDKEFYSRIIFLALPIIIQNGITQFVNMLDNIMVGQVGTTQMTGVAITNQLIFVFNLCIFGAISGAGIFTAQFFGSGDNKGVRDTFRFKLISCFIIAVLGISLFFFAGEPLINLYLKGEGSKGDAASSLYYAREYLNIMLIGLIPAAITQCYSGTLRETGKSVLPMIAGIIAVVVNLVGNYILIFGHFGAPKMGVAGAAVATVASRFVELFVVAAYTFIKREENPFIIGAYRSLHIPLTLVKKIIIKGLPLMLNETMWAMGMAVLNKFYSERGLIVVAANNISQTFWNVFSVAFIAVGASIGIILGQLLGGNEIEKARDYSYKLIAFSVSVSIFFGALYFVMAYFIPNAYNTTDDIRLLATRLMQVSAIIMPIDAFAHACYFTLRSGGKVFITFLFDSGFVWVINVPFVLALTRFTPMSVVVIFLLCHLISLTKCVAGFILVKRGIWIKNMVGEKS